MTAQRLRLGVIGGSGWLGAAIARCVLNAGITPPETLTMSYRSRQAPGFDGIHWTRDNQELVNRSDVVFVSVRPADWPLVVVSAADKLVISVMAGIRLSQLAEQHKTGRVIRSLPNAAAEIAKSYTPWVALPGITDHDRSIVRSIFQACGVEDEVASETDIDYFTGLTGSGPAFPALLASAMMRDAVARGLSKKLAKRAVTTVLIGTGRLFELREDCPDDLVQTFVSYAGTTAAGIEAMRANGIEDAVRLGLDAALHKSVAMGRES